ncbi:ribosome recycling factor [Candidatus Saccharibacteria bacterium]|jgi:ribosome recycling factor|nr:ribosome recycling factor [Candidatus Saccharibacteria bacterium]
MFDTKDYEQKMDGALEHFEAELRKVRTGRAHAGMLDGVMVEAYGAKMPLNQVANVTAPEAQMLLVTPFDPSHVTAISTAIRDNHSLGFNPSDDGRVVRVPVPALTEERRRDMVKTASEKVEDCRIALRNVRQDALKDAKRMKDAKEISEDDERMVVKTFDDLMKKYQEKIDRLFADKEKDILTV